jgi:pimeloyl-ACP methyl ester carboxylesterase
VLRLTPTETPLMIPTGAEHVFGVLVEPPGGTDIAVLFLTAGFNHAGPGKDRLYVRLARQFADAGFAALRIDYVGTGESSGGLWWPDAAHPDTVDVEAAARLLRNRGYERLVVVGSCYGARAALASADRLPGLAAVALLAPPIRISGWGTVGDWTFRWLVRRAVRPLVWRGALRRDQRRVYVHLLRQFVAGHRHSLSARARHGIHPPPPREPDADLVDGIAWLRQRVPTLLVWGDTDKWPIDVEGGPEALRSLLAPSGSAAELRVLSGCVAGLRGPGITAAVIETVGEWSTRLFGDHGGRSVASIPIQASAVDG